MSVKTISKDELRRMEGSEGLILQGCGGNLDEWVDGINDMLTEDGILLNGTRFHDCSTFEHDGSTCLLFPFKDDVELDVGKLAMWRLQTHGNFGGTWLSDYVPNKLGGFISKEQTAEAVQKPDCPLIGQDGNIFNLMGIGSIILVDEDNVEESNLVRQVFYESVDCGKTKKVVALKHFLNKFSPYTEVYAIDHYVQTITDAEKYLHDVDVIIQTADTPRGVINRIINDYSTNSGCASIYCANGTVGPFFIPGRSGSFRDFEEYLNRETNGIYDLFVEIKNKETSRAAPSEVGGPWLAAYYLYNEIVDYFAGIQKLKTENAIIKLSDGGFGVEVLSFK